MERTSDFEQLLFLYKTEGKGISLEQFCINNGINYRAFDRWYGNHHEGVVPVQVRLRKVSSCVSELYIIQRKI